MSLRFVACCLAIATCLVLSGTTPAMARSPLPDTFPVQGDPTRCGSGRATDHSTVACPGTTDSSRKLDILAGTFPDKPDYSKCVMIDNNSNKAYFIPLRTYREWIAFYNAATSPNSPLDIAMRDCSGGGSGGICGDAAVAPATTAPTLGLCSKGTASAVTTDGTNWNWTCTDGTATACSVKVATTPINAGCYVDTHAWDYVTTGTCDGSAQNPNAANYGTNLTETDSITWSVGDATNQGNDAYVFSDRKRYRVTWRGDCDGNDQWCSIWGVRNGMYQATVEVVDRETGKTVLTETVTAEKQVMSCAPPSFIYKGSCCRTPHNFHLCEGKHVD